MANSDKRIVYENDDKNIVVMTPADNCGLTVEQMTKMYLLVKHHT